MTKNYGNQSTTPIGEQEFYGHIQLTPEEEAAAILEGKKKKYFREKHKDYWEELENREPDESDVIS